MKQARLNNQTVYFLGDVGLPKEKSRQTKSDVSSTKTIELKPVRGRLYKPANLPVARFMGETHVKRELAYEMRHHGTVFIVYPNALALATRKEVENYLSKA